MASEEAQAYYTGGGQKVCTGRVVLPVADNIFKCMYFVCVLLKTQAKNIHLKMLSATGRTTLLVHSFCPPPVIIT